MIDSSNAGAKVVFSAGTKDVFCDLPAEMVPSYPGAGIPNSTGSAWGTSYTTSGSGTVVALSDSPTFTTAITATGSLQLTGDSSSNHNIATNQTSNTLTVGGTSATGAITLGQSTGAQNINIATSAANASIVNIGGTGTSTGAINIGRGTGSQTISIASGAAGSTVTTGQTRAINIGTTSFGTGVSNVNIGKYSATVAHTTGLSGNIVTIQAQTLTLNNIGALVIGGNLLQSVNFVSGLPGLTGVARGSRAFVTDAGTPVVFGAVVNDGGGTGTPVPVYYDGTNWRVG